jgi:hypothetical protein
MRKQQSDESILEPWKRFADSSGAKLSVERVMTERAYDQLIRDYGENFFPRDFRCPTAKLEIAYGRYTIAARFNQLLFGNYIADFDVNFRAKQTFAISLVANYMVAQAAYRKAFFSHIPKARIHESIDSWDQQICGSITCIPFKFDVSSLDRGFTTKVSQNAEAVLAEKRIQKGLLKFIKKKTWIWARGVPGKEALSSNGIGGFLLLKPRSTVLLKDMFVFLNQLVEELELAGLIGKL